MKKTIYYFVLTLLVLSLCTAAIISFRQINEYIKDKYSPNSETVSFFNDDYTDLIINFRLVEHEKPVRFVNNEMLVRFEVIKEYIDPHIYYDQVRNKVIITTSDKVIIMIEQDNTAEINRKDVHLDTASQRYDGYLYVPVKTFASLWGITINHIEQNDVVIIESLRNFDYTATVNIPDSVLRKGPSIKEPAYMENIAKNTVLHVIDTKGQWTHVMTSDGVIGYIESDYIDTKFESKETVIKYEQKKLDLPESVLLAWDYVHNSSITKVTYYKDINVISPTFFTVSDETGNISSSASLAYVQNAHKTGYKVWPLVNNNFAKKDQISAVLADSDARRKVIDQLLAYAYICGFDGINIDFENLYLSDKDNLTQFIRELVPLAHERKLAVSIDVGIPGGSEAYSLCYDHEQLAIAADFVMVMTYDQYWSSHEKGGSQAQLSWVEENIQKTLKLIPPDKLVLGIPAYTRLWKTDTDEKVTLHATLTANDVLKLISEKQLTPVWEQLRDGFVSGQYYIEYKENGDLYRAWIEDESSASEKAQLASKYDLRGVCIWMLSQTNRAVWESIADGYFSYVE